MKIAFVILQYLLPQQLLSRLVGRLAECQTPWLKNLLIKQFIQRYKVNMAEAIEGEAESYPNFNAFFTRALKADARPICADENSVACPADGAISQIGSIASARILQAKGQDYSLSQLLGGDEALASQFRDGAFATIYLSPKDYHRVHMPLDGELRQSIYVPGQLFSVNQTTAENVNSLFARNERLICLFDTPAGPMAMILVGAMIVAGIETVWAGQVAPPPRQLTRVEYPRSESVSLKKGEEMGRFKLGSTVILLFGKDRMDWDSKFIATSPTRLGEKLGECRELG